MPEPHCTLPTQHTYSQELYQTDPSSQGNVSTPDRSFAPGKCPDAEQIMIYVIESLYLPFGGSDHDLDYVDPIFSGMICCSRVMSYASHTGKHVFLEPCQTDPLINSNMGHPWFP